MKITVKKLQGGECNVDVLPTTLISEVKRQISGQLKIPVEEQKLLLLGRTLTDEKPIQFYPSIKEGSKLHVVVKKPDGLFEESVKLFKGMGMTEKAATDSAHRFIKIIERKFYQMSWDDVNRLCYELLLEENGEAPAIMENDVECDDNFGL